MNLSETAFLHPDGDSFALRWFTPAVEVDLCGHATLAAAHVLWQSGRVDEGRPIAFRTRSGTLGAERDGEWIALDFPATPAIPFDPEPALVEALGVAPRAAGRSRFDVLVEVSSVGDVERAAPDLRALAGIEARGVILTARGGRDGADFTSRFFAPAAGIDEDPVTGSAHCALGPWWWERLGRARLVGHQASARGGVVRVEVRGQRVMLAGCAVTVLRGALSAPAGQTTTARGAGPGDGTPAPA
jgi:PhzF family phenazine biosynthesis protein